jgi:hypothetical protein
MTTISLPLNIAKALASMASFTDKDAYKLAYVLVSVTPSTVSALASDLYAIIESIYTERNGDGYLEFGINADGAKFINSLKSKNQHEPIEFSLDPASRSVRISGLGSSIIQRYDGEHFGNVWSRFEELLAIENKAEKATPITLDMTLLSRCAKLLTYDGKKAERWEFHLGSETEQRKPSPIHAYSAGVITYHLLQQPLMPRK